MRRGPAIGGHLPRMPKAVLEQMSYLDQAKYHGRRAEIFGKRAGFALKIAILALAVSVILQILRLVLS